MFDEQEVKFRVKSIEGDRLTILSSAANGNLEYTFFKKVAEEGEESGKYDLDMTMMRFIKLDKIKDVRIGMMKSFINTEAHAARILEYIEIENNPEATSDEKQEAKSDLIRILTEFYNISARAAAEAAAAAEAKREERAARYDSPQRSERSDRPQRSDRSDRPQRSDRPDRSDRSDWSDKPPRSDRPSKYFPEPPVRPVLPGKPKRIASGPAQPGSALRPKKTPRLKK